MLEEKLRKLHEERIEKLFLECEIAETKQKRSYALKTLTNELKDYYNTFGKKYKIRGK